mmetsp:Transcript_63247/g.205226  ORF Transcript_63247/g.205226 Transcript_63247/m.205226 type:complete len:201 (-) Transcript_63247:888-1490(-)
MRLCPSLAAVHGDHGEGQVVSLGHDGLVAAAREWATPTVAHDDHVAADEPLGRARARGRGRCLSTARGLLRLSLPLGCRRRRSPQLLCLVPRFFFFQRRAHDRDAILLEHVRLLPSLVATHGDNREGEVVSLRHHGFVAAAGGGTAPAVAHDHDVATHEGGPQRVSGFGEEVPASIFVAALTRGAHTVASPHLLSRFGCA